MRCVLGDALGRALLPEGVCRHCCHHGVELDVGRVLDVRREPRKSHIGRDDAQRLAVDAGRNCARLTSRGWPRWDPLSTSPRRAGPRCGGRCCSSCTSACCAAASRARFRATRSALRSGSAGSTLSGSTRRRCSTHQRVLGVQYSSSTAGRRNIGGGAHCAKTSVGSKSTIGIASEPAVEPPRGVLTLIPVGLRPKDRQMGPVCRE